MAPSSSSPSSSSSLPRRPALNGHARHSGGEDDDDHDESDLVQRRPDRVTIYWPADLAPLTEGSALVGWTFQGGPDEAVVVVAGALSADDERQAEVAWLLSRRLDRKGKGKERDGPTQSTAKWTIQLRVVGRVVASAGMDVDKEDAYSQVWMNVSPCADGPQIRRRRRRRRPWQRREEIGPIITSLTVAPVRSLGPHRATSPTTTAISVVLFDPPDDTMLRFLTLEPLDLRRRSGESLAAASPCAEDRLATFLAGNPQRWFEITGGFPPGMEPGAGLRRAIDCINKVRRARERLDLRKSRCAPGERSSRLASVASGALINITRMAQATLSQPLLLRTRRAPSLLTLSSSCRQLSLRLTQISSFPRLAARLRRQRQQDTLPAADLSRGYVSTWNALWLMANDVLLGMAMSAVLSATKEQVAAWISEKLVAGLLVRDVVEACGWLDDWPGGLKLNTELSSFYRDMYVGLTTLAEQTILHHCIVVPLPALLGLIARAGQYGGGLALQICLLADLARLATLHLRLLHTLARSQYAALLHLLGTLLNLFRGKKRTLLSPRASSSGWELVSAHYDLDQLLLGAIFFTLALFLAPTVAVYHYLFAISVAVAEGMVRFALVEGLVEAVNHLPLLSLVLRVKDPGRVPGGVYFCEENIRRSGTGLRYSVRRLHSHPLGWGDVLRDGFEGHFVATLAGLPGMVRRVFTGEDVAQS
ncbi:Gpi1-domain-containing protein [Jaminaea rosea]|uniref:Gpi1-domain-containing protein n=1 Tax=Jaminaea rosea TaxID=1569628 RepID=A0A316UZ96_9BASI|nr:Gpi1-domain-containing protein [Jaminaea rosea]PWN29243.1 Gpi1-domain-containing protein [Jaminaea rosea]